MKRRRHLFRIVAVAVGLMVPVVIELSCQLLSPEAATGDGYVEYLGRQPLFVLDDDQQAYEIADNRRAYFAADSFPRATNSKTRRIFVLGGSTVQGRPYSLPTSFPTCLETGLKVAAPQFAWDVVNCGGVSYASYRLLPILDEVLNYDPAAIVVCTGHNEFLEFMTYREAVRAIDTFGESAAGWTNLASIRLLRSWFLPNADASVSASKQKELAALPTEVNAILDQSEGWQSYRREVLDRDRIQRQFERNLNRIAAVCREREIPLLFVSPVVNLRDCPPFKSEFDSSIDETSRQQFLNQLAEAVKIGTTDPQAAVSTLKNLCRSQPQYALAWYQLGRQLLGQGNVEEAREAFQTACDEDVCPLRMTSQLRFRMRQVVKNLNVEFIDLHQVLESESRQGVVGDNLLVDHVHPSFASHRKIGALLADRIMEQLAIQPTELQWREQAIENMRNDFEALDSLYFLRGRRTLDNLNGWARGRAHGTELKPSND